MKNALILSFVISMFCLCARSAIDLTTPTGGTITYADSLDGYLGPKAFDDGFPLTTGGRWLPRYSALPNAYVTYAFNDASNRVVSAYKVWNLVTYNWTGRAPKDFTLQGSSNGVDWVVMDTRTGETGWGDGEARLYIFTNTVPYSHFKFNISANNGATDYTGVSELELFESAAEDAPPDQAIVPSPVNGDPNADLLEVLSWTPDGTAESHAVYFGTDTDFTVDELITNTTSTVCLTEYLDFETTYYWRVDSSNQFGVTTGTVWSFTTTTTDPEFVAYDGFEEYTQGLLNGQGAAGDGWTIPWAAFTTGVEVAEVSLSYKAGDVQVDGGTQAVEFVGIERTDAIRRIFTTLQGSNVYFSALVQRKAPIVGDQLLTVGLKDQSAGGSVDNGLGFDFGYPGGKINAEIHASGEARIRVSTGVSVVSNQTYFIVSRLSRGGENSEFEIVDVLVDPTSATEPETGWTRAELAAAASPVIDKLNVRTYFVADGEVEYLDEIRIGTTYESVVPRRIENGTLILID